MKNQLSALIDGELDVEEVEHLLSAMKASGDVKEAWQHYHLIGDAMRDEVQTPLNVSDKIMQALEDEPTVLVTNKQVQSDAPLAARRSKKLPMVWSVAASVAAVMFVGLMTFDLPFNEPNALTPIAIAESVPMEYLQAHQSIAPSSAAYYIQSANYTEPSQ